MMGCVEFWGVFTFYVLFAWSFGFFVVVVCSQDRSINWFTILPFVKWRVDLHNLSFPLLEIQRKTEGGWGWVPSQRGGGFDSLRGAWSMWTRNLVIGERRDN